MSQIKDFSKQFFADFVAARIRAREIEKRQSQPVGQDSGSGPATTAGAETNRAPGSNNVVPA